MSSSIFRTWLDATRPKTLPLAIACILCGSAVAIQSPQFSHALMVLAVITALLLQVLSNLANDYGDALKGTDSDARIGPKRAMQQGLVTANTMKKVISFNVILTIAVGLALVFTAFDNAADIMTFIGLGGLSILASIFYTIGNKPYGYQGLGDLSVLIFFGWIGVAGSFYLQTGTLNSVILLPATACGLLAVCVLNINNLRDIDNDRACGKYTLIVRIGPKSGRVYHQLLLFFAYLCFGLFALIEQTNVFRWLFLFSLPFAIKHGKAVWSSSEPEALRPMMGDILKLALLTNFLFTAGVLLN